MGNCWPSPLGDSVHNYEDTSKNNSPGSGGGGGGGGGGSSFVAVLPPSATTGHIITPDLKVFTYGELKSATRNFRPDTMVGEGGFGRVFKGWVDPETYEPARPRTGIAVAVKKSNPDSTQGHKEWQAEVIFLGKFRHPNLVKLLGYCLEDDRQYLLVYEYVQRGSLEGHLFRRGAETLPWETRLKIATGAARGLAFLHSTEKKVIYRDFKAANILLDEDFNAKLCDFGLAKLGPMNGDTHVTTQFAGTYGYAAPEYMATGHVYIKSDVYGFGVVLLEILTGRTVYDPQRPSREQNLVEWAKPTLPNKRNLKKLMDPKLGENYPLRGAFQAAQLVLKCLQPDQKKRPSMDEVLCALEQVNAIKMKPKEMKSQNRPRLEPANYNQYNASPMQQRYGGNSNFGGVGGGRAHLLRR